MVGGSRRERREKGKRMGGEEREEGGEGEGINDLDHVVSRNTRRVFVLSRLRTPLVSGPVSQDVVGNFGSGSKSICAPYPKL